MEAPVENERIDDLQRDGCRIIQRPDLFCFGMDAVLLASFANVRRGENVLDLCSGNGVVPILMDARLPRGEKNVHFTGVEINSISVDMARRSAAMNGQSDRITFLRGDVREVCRPKAKPAIGDTHEDNSSIEKPAIGDTHEGNSSIEKPAEGNSCVIEDNIESGTTVETEDVRNLAPGSFHCVTVNPPYMTGGTGLISDSEDKMIARHELICTVDDVAAAASRALRFGGHLYMVHRPHRLGDIFRAMAAHGLEIKKMRMVHPFAHKEANMVLIDAAKGGKSYVHVERPLIIYENAGVYTEEVRALYG